MKIRVSVNEIRPAKVAHSRIHVPSYHVYRLTAKQKRAQDAEGVRYRHNVVLRLLCDQFTPAEIAKVTTLSRSCVDDILTHFAQQAQRRLIDILLEGERLPMPFAQNGILHAVNFVNTGEETYEAG